MAKIAYIRVSTKEQNTARQDVAFEGYDKVFTDKASGKNADRPELKAMLEYIREGDTVTVESISRLARNTKDLLEIVDRITEKGAAFVSLKESIDTSTAAGKFMLTVFGAMAELERNYIKERQREGIDALTAEEREQKYQGRKPIEIDDDRFKAECKAWRAGKQTATKTMQRLGLKPNTFYRRVKELGL